MEPSLQTSQCYCVQFLSLMNRRSFYSMKPLRSFMMDSTRPSVELGRPNTHGQYIGANCPHLGARKTEGNKHWPISSFLKSHPQELAFIESHRVIL